MVIKFGVQEVDKPFFLERFPRYCEIREYAKLLARKYPSLVRVQQIGESIQGRPIEMVILQKDPVHPKDALMLEAGIHAREWVTHTTALYFIYYLLQHPHLLNYMDYYVIPCANPDGYEHSHISKRLWRKNLNTNGSADETKWGVDLNRNFSFGYGLPSGSSSDYTSFNHRGSSSFSEPEARSIASALEQYGSYVKLYLALHCYGNLILHPWGYTKEPIADEADLKACGNAAVSAMRVVNFHSKFRVGCLSSKMYHASGGTLDYARGVHNIKFSYTVELHKGGEHGHDPPPSEILNVARETISGVTAMIKFVYQYYAWREHRKYRAVKFINKHKFFVKQGSRVICLLDQKDSREHAPQRPSSAGCSPSTQSAPSAQRPASAHYISDTQCPPRAQCPQVTPYSSGAQCPPLTPRPSGAQCPPRAQCPPVTPRPSGAQCPPVTSCRSSTKCPPRASSARCTPGVRQKVSINRVNVLI